MSGADISRRALAGMGGAMLLMPRLAFAASPQPIVSALAGRFQGRRSSDGVSVFRGIRYGRADRFMAPRPVSRPDELVICDAFGPVAPQSGTVYGAQSEDCLFLNIWTSDARPAARKPVMLYIHGGA